ncbi:prolyl oligopeptidase family serine peptidase [Chryseobacterium sp. WG14]|uniref:prolyl oligopeptidase family serine peptidase n=1 Tax=Chryseobacterium sp. WG14 TaxID=2926909 RepID=UPI00211DD6EC|nr:prolyl oligopeptidase family serine peptidase [Chryseobacterium sp. WG14]MCQ9639503.1 prolyl oligopeptidase family serine peptidase [Chryseobacterium sp. WG14]
MNYFKIAALSIGLLTVSCSTQNVKSAKTASVNQKEEKLTDIQYGTHEKNIMDVYLPADRSPNTAFLISIHGGAWTMGDRKDDVKFVEYLLSQGIAVANINYRYVNLTDTHLPEILDDIDHAVKYLSSHAREWNTRKNGFSISGGSSGAHVSLMYAYTKNTQIKTIIEMCGPVDFTDVQTLQYVKAANLLGVLDKMSGNKVVWNPGDAIPDAYTKTSPVKFINQIPTLIIHGDKDEVVPIQQGYILENALKAKGVQYKMVVVPGAGHLITKLPENEQIVFANVAEWLKKNGTN